MIRVEKSSIYLLWAAYFAAVAAAPVITQIAGGVIAAATFSYLVSGVMVEQQAQGYPDDGSLFKEVNRKSEGVVYLGFTTYSLSSGIGFSQRHVKGKTGLGRTDLGKQANAFRYGTGNTRNANRNVAVFEYREAGTGKLKTQAFLNTTPQPHSERAGIRALKQQGVSMSSITRIYSERQPCSVPASVSCGRLLKKKVPNAKVTWG